LDQLSVDQNSINVFAVSVGAYVSGKVSYPISFMTFVRQGRG